MKKIYSKLLSIIKILSADTKLAAKPSLPELCFGSIVNASDYLESGWLCEKGRALTNASTEHTPGWEPYFKLAMAPKNTQTEARASWSIGESASLTIPIPPRKTDTCVITMRLGARLTAENNHRQVVTVRVNGEKLCSWLFDTQYPVDKLLIVPETLLQRKNPLQIIMETPHAIATTGEDDIPDGSVVGIELYTLTVYDGVNAYLEGLQKKYDEACQYRNELIKIEGCELKDRGELVDIVNNVLMVLDQREGSFPTITTKLHAFLSCPHIQAKNNDTLVFDQNYFAIKYDTLREGIIEHEITSWRNKLFNFKEAVLDAGNYAFRKTSTENLESYSQLDNFLQTHQHDGSKLAELKDKNELVNNLEILLQKTEIESIPPYLEIEMTSFCNFRCVMCSRSMMKFLHTQQNDQQILQISKILPFVKFVTIAGVGEPCASKKLDILSRVLETFKCSTIMFTNGSLLHNHLNAASRFARVNISFDGPNERILGAQRRKSKFKTIVENIQQLKARADQTTIAFSVVVSRINVDEVAAIVKLAGELGVKSASLSPVVNIPLLELKESDRITYEGQLQRATDIAKEYGIALHNNVHIDTFSSKNDTVRNKEELISYFGGLKVPDDASYSLEEIIKRLELNEFSYYPAPVVFADNKWPVAGAPDQPKLPSRSSDHIAFEFDIDREIMRLNHAIERLEKEISTKPAEWFKLPYCLSVWKYGYVKSNGKNRLCPHRNVALGNYREKEPRAVLNSTVIKKYRESMLDVNSVTPMCKECFDHHRTWSLDSLQKTAAKYCPNVKIVPSP